MQYKSKNIFNQFYKIKKSIKPYKISNLIVIILIFVLIIQKTFTILISLSRTLKNFI